MGNVKALVQCMKASGTGEHIGPYSCYAGRQRPVQTAIQGLLGMKQEGCNDVEKIQQDC